MGEDRLQVLEGDAVVLALVLLLVPGLGEERAHRCDRRGDQGAGTLRKRSPLRAGRGIVPSLDRKSLVLVPRPTVSMQSWRWP